MKILKEYLVSKKKFPKPNSIKKFHGVEIFCTYPVVGDEDPKESRLDIDENLDVDNIVGIVQCYVDNTVCIDFFTEEDLKTTWSHPDDTILGKEFEKYRNLKPGESFMDNEGTLFTKIKEIT